MRAVAALTGMPTCDAEVQLHHLHRDHLLHKAAPVGTPCTTSFARTPPPAAVTRTRRPNAAPP
ncbi:hypothetical protein NKG94_15590 [Micromonospora sp. M12]